MFAPATASGRSRLNSGLTAAARQHSFEMVADGYFEHESANGAQFWDRVEQFYPAGPRATGWWARTCSVARRRSRAERAVEIWMGSAGHRKNILSPRWREIGISAVYSSSSGGTYGGGPVTVITTDFGVR